jgi:hypothetical protein
MRKIRLVEILTQMRGKRTGSRYEGVPVPDAIREIRRVSTANFDYTELVFNKLNKRLVKEIINDAGLKYEKKRRTVDFSCEHCSLKQECSSNGEPSSVYIITKPKRFWFPGVIADVVNHCIRVYDTRESIEMVAEVLARYLKKTGQDG